MKLNIPQVLSLSVLLLLPAFAAAGQRKAAKKAVLPRLSVDSSGFRTFIKSAPEVTATTQDAGEASTLSAESWQSLSGAGLMAGAGAVKSTGTTQNTGASGVGGSGGGGASTGKTGPSGGGTVAAGGGTPAGPGTLPEGCTIIDIPQRAGLDLKNPPITMNHGQMFAFKIVMPSYTGRAVGVYYVSATSPDGNYGHGMNISYSLNPCEWTNAQKAAGCAAAGPSDTQMVVNSDGDPSYASMCQLTAGKTYYFNVKNADGWNGPDSCRPGSTCTYWPAW